MKRTVLFLITMLTVVLVNAREAKTFVLVVAVDTYENQKYNVLYAKEDAQNFIHLMGEKNVESDQKLVLLNEDVTKRNVLESIKTLGEKCKKKDKFVFYFKGNGSAVGLYPEDYQEGRDIVTYTDIKAAIAECKAQSKIILVEAPGSNGLKKKEDPSRMQTKKEKKKADKVTVVLFNYDCDKSYLLKEKAKVNMMRTLNQGISGKADAYSDGIITIKELRDYVTYELKKHNNAKYFSCWGKYDENYKLF